METGNKLPEDFKRRWVEALRSGEYKQGKIYLYLSTDDSYCCLGVAACISGYSKEEIDGMPYVGINTENYVSPRESFPDCLIADHKSLTGTTVAFLSDLNDQKEKSFSEIADYIEANL